MEQRERLGSRLGFIMLSAGCAIGCGNVWKFPWITGQCGGGGFVAIYILFLLILGLPVMTMEFAVGRAAQASPIKMYQKIEKKGQKWHIHGITDFIGNICLMAFYTVVTGWILYYFVKFLTGKTSKMVATASNNPFANMITSAKINVTFMIIAVVITFAVLCFELQGGLEKVTKYMMVLLLILILVLAIHSFTLSGAAKGLKFYLVPDLTKINGEVIVSAMNQAFFTLSVGMGSMAIFGSYIDKERSLLGESVNVVILDTFVAIVAGLIMFPACATYGLKLDAGPSLLFNTMSTVFMKMHGGRVWGTLFFLFMTFAALSTTLAVCETILACVRDLTGCGRKLGSFICAIGITCLALTTAFGYNLWSGFHPFSKDTSWLDLWDFIVSTNILPLGSLAIAMFCCYKIGFGWDNFVEEANAGKGLKVKAWMKPIFKYVTPAAIVFVYIYGIANFKWK